MSDTVVLSLIAFASTCLAAILGLAIALLAKLETVHKTTNSKMDELLAVTRTAAHAAGVKEEKDRRK